MFWRYIFLHATLTIYISDYVACSRTIGLNMFKLQVAKFTATCKHQLSPINIQFRKNQIKFWYQNWARTLTKKCNKIKLQEFYYFIWDKAINHFNLMKYGNMTPHIYLLTFWWIIITNMFHCLSYNLLIVNISLWCYFATKKNHSSLCNCLCNNHVSHPFQNAHIWGPMFTQHMTPTDFNLKCLLLNHGP